MFGLYIGMSFRNLDLFSLYRVREFVIYKS